ncbi:hypothetical protein TNCV_1758981 [Trichonephila clavipes]|nr:hypothetical protein TNCV_1758981 [Trichonephila clavipes]
MQPIRGQRVQHLHADDYPNPAAPISNFIRIFQPKYYSLKRLSFQKKVFSSTWSENVLAERNSDLIAGKISGFSIQGRTYIVSIFLVGLPFCQDIWQGLEYHVIQPQVFSIRHLTLLNALTDMWFTHDGTLLAFFQQTGIL